MFTDIMLHRMKLKAIFLELRGVMINDRSLQASLLTDLLLEENLYLQKGEYETLCQLADDRTGLKILLERRGRLADGNLLDSLLQRKAERFRDIFYNAETSIDSLNPTPSSSISPRYLSISSQETVPEHSPFNSTFMLYPDVKDFLFKARASSLKLAVITSTFRVEVDTILDSCQLSSYFDAIVTGEQIQTQPIKPAAYLQTIDVLNQQYPALDLTIHDCLAIESNENHLQAARAVGLTGVGITRCRPLHMLQRLADWTVDRLGDLELDRINSLAP
ncbi:MAG: HAD family hydrolase [Prochlorotrichaceae cyanobacterium]